MSFQDDSILMSWYRTYRPQHVAGLHLEAVRKQLLGFMKAGDFPHALLLTGPKGTGKTSSARIIAKVVNCEKNATLKAGQPLQDACMECESCRSIAGGSALNVIEIDAASHRRIDDVRELREQIYLPPVTGQKNVYIIDEVHMMTNEAFNALLKILEEPPSHALFILATTEAHKIPETITSRCTVIHFQKPSLEEVRGALEQIAKKEKIQVTDVSTLDQIVHNAQGSFRDAVKLFEQIAKGKTSFDLSEVTEVGGQFGEESTVEFLQKILAKDEKGIIEYFQQWQRQDIDAQFVHRQILETLHRHLLRAVGVEAGKSFSSGEVILFLLKAFSQVTIDERLPFPLLPLEICSLEMVLKSKQRSSGSPSAQSKPSPTPTASTPAKSASSPAVQSSPVSHTSKPLVASMSTPSFQSLNSTPPEVSNLSTPAFSDAVLPASDVIASVTRTVSDIDGMQLQEKWNQFLQQIGQRNISIEALLRSTQFVDGAPGKVVLKVFYGFHKEQLELDRYRIVMEECSAVVLGGPVHFEFILDSQAKAKLADEANNISGQVDDSSLAQLAEEILV